MPGLVRAVRAELAKPLGGNGYAVYDRLPGNPELPAAVVLWPDLVQYAETLAGGHRIDGRILLAFSMADADAAQDQLDDAISGPLAWSIIEHQTPLWLSIDVPRAENISTETTGNGVEVLTAELVYQLITNPT